MTTFIVKSMRHMIYLDDQVAGRISGHLGKLSDQFSEARPTLRVDHPTCAEIIHKDV